MNLFDSQRLLPCLAGFAMSAALLWLGSEVFATARSRSLALARRLKVCAILLAGCGLWFPGHFLEPLDAAGTGFFGIAFVAGGLAIALAAIAAATAAAATRKTLPAFAGLTLLTLLAAYGHSLFATPGLFHAALPAGAWGPGIAVCLLAMSLIVITVEFKPSRKAQATRLAGAVLGAGLMTLAASVHDAAAIVVPLAWSEALLLAALCGLTGLLLQALALGPMRETEP